MVDTPDSSPLLFLCVWEKDVLRWEVVDASCCCVAAILDGSGTAVVPQKAVVVVVDNGWEVCFSLRDRLLHVSDVISLIVVVAAARSGSIYPWLILFSDEKSSMPVVVAAILIGWWWCCCSTARCFCLRCRQWVKCVRCHDVIDCCMSVMWYYSSTYALVSHLDLSPPHWYICWSLMLRVYAAANQLMLHTLLVSISSRYAT
jgi:hypothetical protein